MSRADCLHAAGCTIWYADACRPRAGVQQAERAGAVVRTLKDAGAASVLCTAWSPQGTPLVSSDKAGRVTFWQDRAA